MTSFGDFRRLARAGTLARSDAPVLLVGFQRPDDAIRQFRTQTEETVRGPVPALSDVLADRFTQVVRIVKGERNPYGDFIFVGRGSTSDLVLNDPSVSKSHAVFQFEAGQFEAGQREAGRWFLKDNRARNGTHVDGRRLEPGERVALKSGAQIVFGAYASYFLDADHFDRVLRA